MFLKKGIVTSFGRGVKQELIGNEGFNVPSNISFHNTELPQQTYNGTGALTEHL